MTVLPNRYFRAKARKSNSNNGSCLFLNFYVIWCQIGVKWKEQLFFRLEILYPDGWSDSPFLIEIIYSYYNIYETQFSHDISEEDCRREERVAFLDSATSKTPYLIFTSAELIICIFTPKKQQGYSLAVFLAKKIFLQLTMDMGVFEVAEFESPTGFSLRQILSEISRKNHVSQIL